MIHTMFQSKVLNFLYRSMVAIFVKRPGPVNFVSSFAGWLHIKLNRNWPVVSGEKPFENVDRPFTSVL